MAWRFTAAPLAASAAGSCVTWDARNSVRNIPFNYVLQNATTFNAYSPGADEFIPLGSPALTGTFGAGACAVMHPTQGPRGTITTGATTTSVVLSTALPAAVAINQLANRGDGVGFTIRIIGLAAGKTEERVIVGNTAGTAPTILLDSALTFTPASGDLYEIRSGRVYMLSAGTLAAGMFKWYDVATNSFSGNLATTNLPATVGGDSSMIALSEGLVPSDAADSTVGYLGALTSAAGNTSTNLNLVGAPATLFANEYRNFQVRIVSDSTTPAAVGQRRRITSHTGGASPSFTVPAWTTTPSATATAVIENDDDKILLFTNQAFVYTYNITANTWDTSTWAAPVAGGAGTVACLSHGITRDTTGYARHSFIYRLRGGAGNQIDVLDIAGAATGSWSNDIAYGNKAQTFTTGTCGAYDPITNGGRYLYLNANGTTRHLRFDVRNRVMEPFTTNPYPVGAAIVGGRLGMAWMFDGATKVAVLSELIPSVALQAQIIIET
jgi:hypothetical protein